MTRLNPSPKITILSYSAASFQVGIVPRVLYRYRVAENSLMQRYDLAEEKSFAVVRLVRRRALTRFAVETGDTEQVNRCFNSGLILANFNSVNKMLFTGYSA